jgi:hypothetical protein
MKWKLACGLIALFVLSAEASAGRRGRTCASCGASDGGYAVGSTWAPPANSGNVPATATQCDPGDDALAEVNARRARRGLRAFIRDEGLTAAAIRAAQYRATYRIAGHSSNDFAFLPAGSLASAAGCAAWEPSWGWGSCCSEENWTYAGASWAMGSDGRRYMHLFVR